MRLLTALALATSLAILPQNIDRTIAEKPDWSGYWSVTGIEKSKAYHGVVYIAKYGSGYAVTTTIGSDSITGAGQVKGGMLAVGWHQGDAKGCTVYCKDGDKVHATWVSLPGTGEIGREELEFLRKVDD